MATDALRLLHDDVDREAAAVAAKHGERLRCARGCSDCCVDDLTVFEVEADAIREAYGSLLAEELPHPAGGCAFLDGEGACRVSVARPYVCRTQGLPLRWFGDEGEYRDICPLNEPGGPALTALPEEACWTIGPFEGRLSELQQARGPRGARVALRSLFRLS